MQFDQSEGRNKQQEGVLERCNTVFALLPLLALVVP